MAVTDRALGLLEYRKALRHMNCEQHDICSALETLDSPSILSARESESWRQARDAEVGETVPHGGTVLADIRGMGKVYDWRPSPWTPVNGGKIRPLVFVDHIPVIPNMPGIADFIRLRDVLVAQGLMIQCATDASGNVALFTPMNRLCFQARGANSFSCGCEHMHFGINDAWTARQLNASSYVHWLAREHHGIRAHHGQLAPGSGVVRVVRRGAVTHKEVSHFAGFDDRSDPGPIYERDEGRVIRGVVYFDKHRHFGGF